MPLTMHISDNGALKNIQSFYKDIQKELRTITGYAGMKAAAQVVIRHARKNIKFTSRHGAFGLAGSFGVITNPNQFRVWANYGGPGRKHGHLIEWGTSRGGPAFQVLTSALKSKRPEMEQAALRAMQKTLDRFRDKYKTGTLSKRDASLFRKASRLHG